MKKVTKKAQHKKTSKKKYNKPEYDMSKDTPLPDNPDAVLIKRVQEIRDVLYKFLQDGLEKIPRGPDREKEFLLQRTAVTSIVVSMLQEDRQLANKLAVTATLMGAGISRGFIDQVLREGVWG